MLGLAAWCLGVDSLSFEAFDGAAGLWLLLRIHVNLLDLELVRHHGALQGALGIG